MNFPLSLTRPLVIFDLETTGLSPRRDRIVELAACRVNVDGTEETKCWLLNPTVHIPEETTAIHGIADADVAQCPTFADQADEIADFFADADIGGFNSDRFDIPCLEEEFVRVGINFNSANRRRVDVQRIYHLMEPRNLSSAVKYYLNRSHDGAHGAEADASATLEVLKAQLANTLAKPQYDQLPRSVAALDEFLVPHDPLNADRNGCFRWKNNEWVVNFGKKKGESLKRLMISEPNFFKWMLKGDFDADARMVAADVLEGRLPPPPELPANERG